MSATKAASDTRKNFFLDISLAIAFFIAMSPMFTGISIHEWLSVALGGAVFIHLALHWRWLVATTRRFFGRLPLQARINYALNFLLLAAFTLTMVSGVMISKSVLPLLGVPMQPGFVWKMLHHTMPNVLLVVTGLHIALHWKWIVNAFQRYILRRRPARVAAHPALARDAALEAQH